jgi:type VI secretion system protein ImpK
MGGDTVSLNSAAVHSNSYLLVQFRDFYREVIRLRKMAQAGVLKFQAMSTAGEIPSLDSMVHTIWQNLALSLDQMLTTTDKRSSEVSIFNFREAVYIMAALADEIFLNLDWEGRDLWQEKLLESYLFQTHVAGEQFFTKLDSLLDARDPGSVELAAVYLMAISLGFQGKYRTTDLTALHAYREKLFTYIFRRDPELLNQEKVLFPNAYEHTIARGTGKLLPHPRRWLIALACIIAGFMIFQHYLWVTVKDGFEPVTEQILHPDKQQVEQQNGRRPDSIRRVITMPVQQSINPAASQTTNQAK